MIGKGDIMREKLTTCKSCGEEIAKSAKTCPKCGGKNKKPIFKYVEDCEHCFYCQFVCKKDALKVVPNYASEHLMQSFEQYK